MIQLQIITLILSQQIVLMSVSTMKVVVEWLPLLVCVCEVQGSKQGPETGYPYCFRSLPRKAGIVP
jgi:hypothetical protein